MSEYDYLERLIASVKPDDRGSLDALARELKRLNYGGYIMQWEYKEVVLPNELMHSESAAHKYFVDQLNI